MARLVSRARLVRLDLRIFQLCPLSPATCASWLACECSCLMRTSKHIPAMWAMSCVTNLPRARRNDSARAGDLLPLWPGQLFLHPLKAWAWVPPQSSHDLPALFAFESEAFRLQAQDPVGESGPCLGLRSAHPRKRPSRFTFRLMTVNILTLLDAGSNRLGEPSCELQGLRGQSAGNSAEGHCDTP